MGRTGKQINSCCISFPDMGVTKNVDRASLGRGMKCSKIRCMDGCTTLNALKTTELYTFYGWIL
jgi:hypothetical protein